MRKGDGRDRPRPSPTHEAMNSESESSLISLSPLRKMVDGSSFAPSTRSRHIHYKRRPTLAPHGRIYPISRNLLLFESIIDCPTGDSSIAATVVKCRQLKSPPTEEFSPVAFVVHSAISVCLPCLLVTLVSSNIQFTSVKNHLAIGYVVNERTDTSE